MDLVRMAEEHSNYFFGLPCLLRDKLVLTVYGRSFGGNLPEIHITNVIEDVVQRRISGKLNKPEARIFWLELAEIRDRANVVGLIAEVELVVGTHKKKEVVDLVLLLSTPFYRQKAVAALRKFVFRPRMDLVDRHFKKNQKHYLKMFSKK